MFQTPPSSPAEAPPRASRGSPIRREAATALLLLTLAGVLPARLTAQTIRGRMLEAATGVPVPGALIELRDARDSAVDRVLTDEGGRYALEAGTAGTYRLHAERIGFRDWDSDSFRLAAGQSITRTIQVSTQPVSVAGLSVQAERKCRLAHDQGVATTLVWAEVEKALRLTLLSQKGEHYHYITQRIRREMDEQGKQVLGERVHIDTTVKARPYHTLPPDTLVREGFVKGTVEMGQTYYAPDAQTLLSEPFIRTHCIEVEGQREVNGEDWVGLAFRPTSGRSLPDVAGALWLASDGSELREMDFHFVNSKIKLAPRHWRDAGVPGATLPTSRDVTLKRLGGRIRFTRLPSGRWIIRDWMLTMPRIGAVNAWWDPGRRYAYVLAGLHQEGGQVVTVRDDAGRILFSHAGATLTGFVADSTRGKPLAGAVVRLEGTPFADTTDADGAFRIAGVPEGDYTVSFSHPRLDSLGVKARELVVPLRDGKVTSVNLGVPGPTAKRLASGCHEPATGGTPAANLVGVLRDETTGVPLPFTTLTLVSHAAVVAGKVVSTSDILAQGRASAEGTFHLCGVPGGRGLGLVIRFPGRRPATLQVDLPAGRTVQQEVRVPASAETGISGRVVSDADGSPLAGASVRVSTEGSGTDRVTTGNDGRFRFGDVVPGRHEVRVELSGYGPAVDTVSAASGEALTLDVRLATHVVAAPPIQVIVMRPPPTQGLSRRSRRLYELNTPNIDTLLKRVASTADLLRSLEVPGLLVEPMEAPKSTGAIPSAGAAALPAREGLCVSTTRGHGETSGFGSTSNRGCRMVKIYVDDAPLTPDMAYTYLEDLDPTTIARIQFVPAVDAGARYGTGSENGVLLIYTRAGEKAREKHGRGGRET